MDLFHFYAILLYSFHILLNAETKSCNNSVTVFDRHVLSGHFQSDGSPLMYPYETTCTWIIEPGFPWTAIRLIIEHVNTEPDFDVILVHRIENGHTFFIRHYDGVGSNLEYFSSTGGGLKIVFISDDIDGGIGFKASFSRFTSIGWSGIGTTELQRLCKDITDAPSVFISDSCYVLGPPDSFSATNSTTEIGVKYEEAFTMCDRFPNGHLALLNSKELVRRVYGQFKANISGDGYLWVGLMQREKRVPEISTYDWEWVLDRETAWPAEFNETLWDTETNQPNNAAGHEDCGALFRTLGLHDTYCNKQNQYICEYSSRYTCPPAFLKAEKELKWLSPTLEADVSREQTCDYLISAGTLNSIDLTLVEIDLGDYDYVIVSEISGYIVAYNLATWAGNSIEELRKRNISLSVISRSGRLRVTYRIRNPKKTFRASYRQIESNCVCKAEENIVLAAGKKVTLTSPGYPAPYCSNLNCHWIILTADPDYVVRITVNKFDFLDNDYMFIHDIEQDDLNINQTVLAFYHGSTQVENMEQIASLGDELIKPSIVTGQQKMMVTFTTGENIHESADGFTLEAQAVMRDRLCSCHPSFYNATSGSVSFEHTASNCNFVHCLYYILLPAGSSQQSRLYLNMKVQPTQPYGSLVVFDGLFYKLSKDFDNYYSIDYWRLKNFDALFSLQTHNEGATLLYHTEAIGIPTEGYGLWVEFEWGSNCTCAFDEFELSASTTPKMFSSPRQFGKYCAQQECSWRITAPEGHNVVLEIEKFDTEADHDILYIFDELHAYKARLSKILSGQLSEVELVRSSNRFMKVEFYSDHTIERDGFDIRYYSEPWTPVYRDATLIFAKLRYRDKEIRQVLTQEKVKSSQKQLEQCLFYNI